MGTLESVETWFVLALGGAFLMTQHWVWMFLYPAIVWAALNFYPIEEAIYSDFFGIDYETECLKLASCRGADYTMEYNNERACAVVTHLGGDNYRAHRYRVHDVRRAREACEGRK